MIQTVNLTSQEIKNRFNSQGIHISKIDEKGEKTNGMTVVISKVHHLYFPSFQSAYEHFLQMKWI
jgi:ACT domain-containing protein